MRPSADSDQKVPPHTEGGSSASGHLTDRDKLRAEMAARVAAERQRIEAQVVAEGTFTAQELEGMASLGEVLQAVAAADNGHAPRRHAVVDAAPVRRKGAPAPASRSKSIREPLNSTPPKKRTKPRKTGQIEDITDEQLLAEAGIEPFYSTIEAAQFFDRTTQWIYWGLGRDAGDGAPVFIYPDGSPIVPQRIGDPVSGRRRFTLPVIKDILLSSYRRGNIEPDELKKILRRIRINQLGGEWREREGWHKIKGKWVHPKLCTQIDGKWVKKKGSPDDKDSTG